MRYVSVNGNLTLYNIAGRIAHQFKPYNLFLGELLIGSAGAGDVVNATPAASLANTMATVGPTQQYNQQTNQFVGGHPVQISLSAQYAGNTNAFVWPSTPASLAAELPLIGLGTSYSVSAPGDTFWEAPLFTVPPTTATTLSGAACTLVATSTVSGVASTVVPTATTNAYFPAQTATTSPGHYEVISGFVTAVTGTTTAVYGPGSIIPILTAADTVVASWADGTLVANAAGVLPTAIIAPLPPFDVLRPVIDQGLRETFKLRHLMVGNEPAAYYAYSMPNGYVAQTVAPGGAPNFGLIND